MHDAAGLPTGRRNSFCDQVIDGLSRRRKSIPSQWLYDRRGLDLFERICDLPDYYPARVEHAIIAEYAEAIASFLGPDVALVDYGAGASTKAELLLAALERPRLYIPIDIAGSQLPEVTRRVRSRFPVVDVRAVVADFTEAFDLPITVACRRGALFTGTTIGNLAPGEVTALLRRMRRHLGPGGGALVGVDLKKDVGRLLRAYDDPQGVTAAFDLNLLHRINRELGGDLPIDRFRHEARWNAADSAVEMHLVSLDARIVTVAGRRFSLRAGESIRTEFSRKYDLPMLQAASRRGGWRIERLWTDPDALCAVLGLRPREGGDPHVAAGRLEDGLGAAIAPATAINTQAPASDTVGGV